MVLPKIYFLEEPGRSITYIKLHSEGIELEALYIPRLVPNTYGFCVMS